MPRYRVQCVIRENGSETTIYVTASSPERARERVHALGHITGKVTEEPDASSSPPADASSQNNNPNTMLVALVVCAAVMIIAAGAVVIALQLSARAARSAELAVSPTHERAQGRGTPSPTSAQQPAQPAAGLSPPSQPEKSLAAAASDGHRESPGVLTPVWNLKGQFIRVPVQGWIGEDCVVAGVERSLKAAVDARAAAIVFDIDSGGGDADAGRRISHLIDEYRGKLIRVAVVHRAHSAAMFIAVACDLIVMEEGSAIGSAVAFSQDETTGSVEVDAKLNAALSSEIAGIASANGHSPDVVMAMGVMSKELYWWRPSKGEPGRLTATRPNPEATDVEVLDTSESVLGLDAAKADKIGFAFRRSNPMIYFDPSWREEPEHRGTKIMLSALQEVAAAREELAAARKREEAAARQAAQRLLEEKQRLEAEARAAAERQASHDKAVDEVAGMIRKLRSYIDDANRKDPSSFNDYYYSTRSGLLVPDSQLKWTSRSDTAIAAWETVRSGWKDIAKRMTELGLDEAGSTLKAEVEAGHSEAEMRISGLRERRVRYR